MFYIPLRPENWERFLDPSSIYLGFRTEAWRVEAAMAIDPATGQFNYTGLNATPDKFAVLPNMLPVHILKETWNFFADKFAASGIGKFLGIESGIEKNPFRIDFFLGFQARTGEVTLRPPGGPGFPVPAAAGQEGGLPAIGAVIPVYKDEITHLYNHVLKKSKEIAGNKKVMDTVNLEEDATGMGFYLVQNQKELWGMVKSCKQGKNLYRKNYVPAATIYIPLEVLLGNDISLKGDEKSKYKQMVKTIQYGGNNRVCIVQDADELEKMFKFYEEVADLSVTNLVTPTTNSSTEAIAADKFGKYLEMRRTGRGVYETDLFKLDESKDGNGYAVIDSYRFNSVTPSRYQAELGKTEFEIGKMIFKEDL